MRLLVDTQCWLWMAASPDRLSASARAIVGAAEHELLLSAASVWEVAIKHALGKLQLPEPPERYVPSRVTALRMTPLAIEHTHAIRVASLPDRHRDPFDRLLIAQALVEDVPILTADPAFAAYGVRVIEA